MGAVIADEALGLVLEELSLIREVLERIEKKLEPRPLPYRPSAYEQWRFSACPACHMTYRTGQQHACETEVAEGK